MKLKEYLVDKTEKDIVKIGFKNGSSFIYCGPCYPVVIQELLKRISKSQYELHKEKMAKAKYDLYDGGLEKLIVDINSNDFKRVLTKFISGINVKEDEIPKEAMAEIYMAVEKCRVVEHRRAESRYAEAKKEMEYKPFDALNREVVDVSSSIDEDKATIVLLDGDWSGAFWTTGECQRKLNDEIENIKRHIA